MAQKLGALALLGVLSSVPSTHIVAYLIRFDTLFWDGIKHIN